MGSRSPLERFAIAPASRLRRMRWPVWKTAGASTSSGGSPAASTASAKPGAKLPATTAITPAAASPRAAPPPPGPPPNRLPAPRPPPRMAQDDARLVGADLAPEDAVAPARVALLVRPARQLLGRGRVPERHGTLPHHEAEHDPGRFRPRAHAGILSHAPRPRVKPAAA